MNINAVVGWCIYLCFIPFVAISLILVHYFLVRVGLRQRKRPGKKHSRIYSCCLAMGMTFLQVMWLFYRPSAISLLEAQQDEDADEDDDGDPESLNKQLHRQLKKIRRGETVDRLVLRL
jgi:hypothetical protein